MHHLELSLQRLSGGYVKLCCGEWKAHEQSLPLAQASQAHFPSLEHTPAREQSQSEAHRNAALKFAQPGSVNHISRVVL
jgi:hypothetical protein